jgi:hypothetical protein
MWCFYRWKVSYRYFLFVPTLINSSYVVAKKLTRFAHLIQCSPRLQELYIEHNYTVILFRDVKHCGIKSVNGTSSTRFPEFGADVFWHNPDYARALSSNVQLAILLASKLNVFYYKGSQDDSLFGDLARIVDILFSHSTWPICLKELTLNIDGHPSDWLFIEHLVWWIGKLFKSFPVLICFTLYFQLTEALWR